MKVLGLNNEMFSAQMFFVKSESKEVKNTSSNQAWSHLLGSATAGILMRIKENQKEGESGFSTKLTFLFIVDQSGSPKTKLMLSGGFKQA